MILKTRVDWIDELKGLGMLFVVLGHNIGVWSGAPDLARAIYLFHMPLFFFSTGLTTDLHGALLGKVRRVGVVVVQYFVLSLGMVPLGLLFGLDVSMASLIAGVIYGTGHTIDVTPLWFLPCLVCSLFYAFLSFSVLDLLKIGKASLVPIAAASLSFALAGTLLIEHVRGAYEYTHAWGSLERSGAFWSADVAVLGTAFLLFGVLWRRAGVCFDRLTVVSLAVTSALAVLWAAVYFGVRTDLHFRRFSPGAFALVAALVGIIGSIALVSLFSHVQLARRFLGSVGRSSLVILVLHNGLQNRGARLVLEPVFGEGATFWLVAGLLSIAIPMILDVFVIRRLRLLNAIVYPKLNWIARMRRPGVDCAST